jgi:SAM-dependent methyltransferase
VNDDTFQRYSRYYDLLYRDKNYAKEVEYVAGTLRNCLPGARGILEFGSGTGRHGRLLAEYGYEVVGVERSPTMAVGAERIGGEAGSGCCGKFDCVQGDIRTASVGRAFDAVLALFHVVSYQTSNDDLVLTFRNASRHLRPGGVFLFDVWHGPAVLMQRPEVRVKRVEDGTVSLTRIAEPVLDTRASVVDVRYTMLVKSKSDEKLVSFQEDHRLRYLFPSEIDLIARQTAFNVELSEEFLTGAKPSESTWGVAYLLRKS